jgi:flavodoxin
MKQLLIAFPLLMMCMVTGCAKAQQKTNAKKVLIVYLSRTQNTKAIAEIIQQQVAGELTALELQSPYRGNYQAIVAQVAKENETGYLPPLKTKIDSIGQYDVIFIGFPTWGMQLPPPIKSFLHQYNLEGKTIIPFNTNAGYGIGSTFQTVRELCPKSKVLEGFTMKGGIERDGQLLVIKGTYRIKAEAEVKKWIAKISTLTSNNGR